MDEILIFQIHKNLDSFTASTVGDLDTSCYVNRGGNGTLATDITDDGNDASSEADHFPNSSNGNRNKSVSVGSGDSHESTTVEMQVSVEERGVGEISSDETGFLTTEKEDYAPADIPASLEDVSKSDSICCAGVHHTEPLQGKDGSIELSSEAGLPESAIQNHISSIVPASRESSVPSTEKLESASVDQHGKSDSASSTVQNGEVAAGQPQTTSSVETQSSDMKPETVLRWDDVVRNKSADSDCGIEFTNDVLFDLDID